MKKNFKRISQKFFYSEWLVEGVFKGVLNFTDTPCIIRGYIVTDNVDDKE